MIGAHQEISVSQYLHNPLIVQLLTANEAIKIVWRQRSQLVETIHQRWRVDQLDMIRLVSAETECKMCIGNNLSRRVQSVSHG